MYVTPFIYSLTNILKTSTLIVLQSTSTQIQAVKGVAMNY